MPAAEASSIGGPSSSSCRSTSLSSSRPDLRLISKSAVWRTPGRAKSPPSLPPSEATRTGFSSGCLGRNHDQRLGLFLADRIGRRAEAGEVPKKEDRKLFFLGSISGASGMTPAVRYSAAILGRLAVGRGDRLARLGVPLRARPLPRTCSGRCLGCRGRRDRERPRASAMGTARNFLAATRCHPRRRLRSKPASAAPVPSVKEGEASSSSGVPAEVQAARRIETSTAAATRHSPLAKRGPAFKPLPLTPSRCVLVAAVDF